MLLFVVIFESFSVDKDFSIAIHIRIHDQFARFSKCWPGATFGGQSVPSVSPLAETYSYVTNDVLYVW